MSATHGKGDPGPCPAVPPNPVVTPPSGGLPAPAASSRLTISRPLAPSRTTSVWTVPETSVTGRRADELGPVADMVQVPAGMGAYGLTEANDALAAMSPPQLQWNLTVCSLSDACITPTTDFPAPLLTLPLMPCT